MATQKYFVSINVLNIRVWMGRVLESQLSAKFPAISQLSAKFSAISQLSVNFNKSQ